MCGNMADIQPATAENRRGKQEEERRRKHGGKNIMFASPTQGGHNEHFLGHSKFGLLISRGSVAIYLRRSDIVILIL